MKAAVLRLLLRELRLAYRHAADSVAALLFFLLVVALFPLGLGPDAGQLRALAPGAVWIAALLAALLPLDRLFGADFEDGSLDLLLLQGLPGGVVALIKAAAHWLSTGLPLLLAAAPAAIMLRLPGSRVLPLLLSLLPGTLTLSLLGSLGAALVIGARRGGVLLPLLVLPLVTPILIFGTAAAGASGTGLAAHPAFLILCAYLCLCLPLCPWAAGAALRAAVE
ncbi:heme exporter protein CcmB [Acidisoma sp. C75]